MMQLSAITDEISQDFEHALDVLKEYGATGTELRGLWGTNIADLTDEQVERALAALRERGLEVVALSTPFFKCDLEAKSINEGESVGRMHLAAPRGLEQQMELLHRCIRLAKRFDTKLIRVFSFWRKEALTLDVENRIVEAFREPVAIAERDGVILALENEHACFLGTGEETARIMKRLDSPSFKVVWDPGNAFHAGEKPFPNGYDAIKQWVVHVHVKDAITVDTPDHGKQARWCVVGEGEIDYSGQFEALRRDGYSGYISLETHYIPTLGSGPNGEGLAEDGSRPCLAALQKLLSL